MVYYSSSLGKIRFNRNILYCKFVNTELLDNDIKNLIETFCIVNLIIYLISKLLNQFNRNILYCKSKKIKKF